MAEVSRCCRGQAVVVRDGGGEGRGLARDPAARGGVRDGHRFIGAVRVLRAGQRDRLRGAVVPGGEGQRGGAGGHRAAVAAGDGHRHVAGGLVLQAHSVGPGAALRHADGGRGQRDVRGGHDGDVEVGARALVAGVIAGTICVLGLRGGGGGRAGDQPRVVVAVERKACRQRGGQGVAGAIVVALPL